MGCVGGWWQRKNRLFGLRVGRYSPKAQLQFKQRVRDEVVGHRLAVIEPAREQDVGRESNGRRGIRTCDFHRVRMAL
jgi:hypothetical protein